MIEVKLNKSNDNPFYGMTKCLALFQQMAHGNITTKLLDDCYDEVKDDRQKRELFFTLLFSMGDVTGRQHNIFKGIKTDGGGNANREGFYNAVMWMKEKHREQFLKFLNAKLFNEFNCFDTLFRSRIKTSKTKVVKTYDVFADEAYRTELANYVYAVINGTNDFDKLLVSKFLTPPRLSKRSKHKKMLDETRAVMRNKALFLAELSKLMGWEYVLTDTVANFKGYRQWRTQFNGSLESKVFSTGAVKTFTEQQFIDWIDKMPSQARFRVRNKVLYSKNADESLKWHQLAEWYRKWEAYKEQKQSDQRALEEKVRQGQANEEDKKKLAEVKKQAQVNTGAVNFNELYRQICANNVDKLKLESFINKVNLPYNTLVILDDSGSMTGEPFKFAAFLAAVCLVKNPDDDGRNLLGFFNTNSHWHSYIDKVVENTPNGLIRRYSAVKKVSEPFVDPTKSFYDNYKRIENFCFSVFNGGCTDISQIPESLNRACQSNPEMLDALKSYPVWTIISDNEWNRLPTPEASINDFFRRCEKYFGFKPFIIAIDVAVRMDTERFSGIDNMIYIPSNLAQIEQVLTNFKDMDVFDIYTPLQSLYRSNRYALVRENTL